MYLLFIVSVPLRGLYFFMQKSLVPKETKKASFRPLTGIIFFYMLGTSKGMNRSFKFPSPYGDYIFLYP